MSAYGTSKAYRIQVEGLSVEFVSHAGMEQTLADGRQRIRGLDSTTLFIEEEVDIVRGEIESGGFSVRVIDRWEDKFFTDFFVKQPGTVTWLTAQATKTATSLTVMDSSDWSADDIAYIGTETIKITGTPNSTTLSVERGLWDSVAQAHYVGVGEELHLAKIGDRPTTIEGRRVRIFRYDSEDDPQGDGTQIYMGVAVSDAQLEPGGGAFSFRCDPITSIFKVDLSSDIDKPTQLRGISYHGRVFGGVFEARIWEVDSSTAYDGDIDTSRQAFITVPNPNNPAHASLNGHFETQEDFVAALNAEILAALDHTGSRPAGTQYTSASNIATSAGFDYDIRAFVDEESGKWGIKFRTSGAARWFKMQTLGLTQLVEGEVAPVVEGPRGGPPDVTTNTEYTLIAGAPGTDRIVPSAARVPRGILGWPDRGERPPEDLITGERSPGAFYLNSFVAADVGDYLVVGWKDREGDAEDSFRIGAIDAADRRVNSTYVFGVHTFTPATQPDLRIRRQFAQGHVGSFMRALCTESPEKANLAAMPLITGGISHEIDYDNESGGPFNEGDRLRFGGGAIGWVVRVDDNGSSGTLYVDLEEGIVPVNNETIVATTGTATADVDGTPVESTEGDVASWSREALRAANGRAPLLTRAYQSASAVELMEMLSQEFRLCGVFPRIEADGRVGIKRLRLPTGVSKADFTLNSSNIITDESPPEWERNALGSVNTIEIKTRYDYIEDEHVGVTHTVRDVTAFSTRRGTRKVTIEPKSVGTSLAEELTPVDAVEIAQRLLGIYGQPYSVLTVEVDLRPQADGETLLTKALVGSIANITSHRIPNVFTGERGVSGMRGLVISRSWDLARGRGILKLITSDADAGGYTPTVNVTGDSALGGDQYDLTVEFLDPEGKASTAPEGSVLSDFYDVGFALELHTWDSSSYTSYTCTVDAVDDDAWELRVTFDSTPTISGTQFLSFAQSTYSGLVDTDQSNYAYFAQSDGKVDFDSETQNAKEYGA